MAKAKSGSRKALTLEVSKGDAKPLPLYAKIKHALMEKIASGEWADGMRLPSEHELVAELGVSRMTVHRAMRELTDHGVLSRHQGIGTFVSPPAASSDLMTIRDIADDIRERGHTHSARVIALEAIRADVDLATTFEARVGAKLFHSIIVHLEGETPIQLEERFVNASFAPDYLKQDFTRCTPSTYLQSVGRATEIEQVIYAATADTRAREILQISARQPCILLMRRTWRGNVPATKSVFTYPGDRYSLSSRYKVSQFDRA